MTLTTLRPSASGYACSIIASDTSVGGSSAPTASVKQNTSAPMPTATTPAQGPVLGRAAGLEAVGEAAQHEDEQHRGQRLDGDLGEGEVGRALDEEEAGHRVAGHAEEQRGGEAAVDGGGGEAEAEDERERRRPGPAC